MTDRCIQYTSTSKLDCGCVPANVLLCLAADLVLPEDCPLAAVGDDVTAELVVVNVIEATLTACEQVSGVCGNPLWKYKFTFDDADLYPDTILTPTSIEGVICDGCLVSFIQETYGNEPFVRTEDDGSQTFVSNHGCEYPLTGTFEDGDVPGDLTVGGTLTVAGATSLSVLDVSGTFNADGNTTLGAVAIAGTLDVAGVSALGSVTVAGTLDVAGNSLLGTVHLLGELEVDSIVTLDSHLTVAGTLGVTGTTTLGVLVVSSTATVTGNATFNGNVSIAGAGKALKLKDGSNNVMGVSTLVAGTKTVNNTLIATGDRVLMSRQTTGGTAGNLSLGTITNGVSFVINSSNAADTSDILWVILKPL